jgi:hypothetical protein
MHHIHPLVGGYIISPIPLVVAVGLTEVDILGAILPTRSQKPSLGILAWYLWVGLHNDETALNRGKFISISLTVIVW